MEHVTRHTQYIHIMYIYIYFIYLYIYIYIYIFLNISYIIFYSVYYDLVYLKLILSRLLINNIYFKHFQNFTPSTIAPKYSNVASLSDNLSQFLIYGSLNRI